MKVCVAGAGAFGQKHLQAIAAIEGVEVVSLVGGSSLAQVQAVAEHYGIGHATLSLDQALARPGLDAVIVCSPTPVHAAQAMACLEAGKHVQVEIPMADNLADARALLAAQRRSGLIAMAGHTRRYNPGHQWIHQRIASGQLRLQHLDVQTFFFRRTNINLAGQPRSWTDHLLWHHACHTVDLFQYQTGQTAAQVHAMQGPIHPDLGIALDMSVQMRSPDGALCSLTLSFNNQGLQGTFFRYICDSGTYIARYDELLDGDGQPVDLSGVDVSLNGIELQDRDFFECIVSGREPRASLARVLPAYETLDRLEKTLA
ncbi:MAG: Gfo/Idh/MocA family oxidoreductase [Alcaligenaceae bacterium]|nr:Gfo/Idh/MocA family oxidoreductase [Alcaligenaceae bacterium]